MSTGVTAAAAVASTTRSLRLSSWVVVAAFGAYFCMYGFRRPFTAAGYEGLVLWGVGYKSVLVTAQILGYMIAKFIGIRVIAEIAPAARAQTLLLLVGTAHGALLLFGLIPAPWNVWCMFLNGLSLGMVFGLVLGFLEGRRVTEALTAGLCASFILADGVTKSVGATLLAAGVSPMWMPFTAGLCFVLPLIGCVWMLSQVPAPTAADVAERGERAPLNRAQRHALLRRHATGLTFLVSVYVLMTVLRSVRADFAPELWTGLGYVGQPSLFTRSEVLIMFGVVLATGFTVLVDDNRRAFNLGLLVSMTGFALALAGVVGQARGLVDGFTFMVLIGLGLYLPYVAMHTTIFERLLAMTGERGNLGFLMYVADAFGYLAYVGVVLSRGVIPTDEGFLHSFVVLAGTVTLAAMVLLTGGWLYVVPGGHTR